MRPLQDADGGVAMSSSQDAGVGEGSGKGSDKGKGKGSDKGKGKGKDKGSNKFGGLKKGFLL